MEADRPRAQIERITDTYAIALWKQLVLWVVDGHTPLAELEQLRHIVRSWARGQAGAKNVTLVVIHSTESSMTMEERRSVARMIDETKHDRLASATVILADGMLGALHRSILTGISFLSPPPHPVKFCADVRSAVTFLHPHIEVLSGRVPERHVVAMADDLHAEILGFRSRQTHGQRPSGW